MSSLLREEMDRVLFRPEGQKMVEFIEIEEQHQGRHFLCVSISKDKEAQISVVLCRKVKHSRTKKLQHCGLEDSYERTEIWALEDLLILDGRDPDIDDPYFLMHFDSVRSVRAVSCAAKYTLARCLLSLSRKHQHTALKLKNFDLTYIQPTAMYSDRGDCVVLAQICFYAFNLVCLSLCPVPL
ncbi:exocyst complex component 1-like [Siphateles boraxobius]|uniref:exocyst complex component 1-like n=1 Tax=Siphateles boraxobius TaxID=180520 RepID=UPI004062AA82